jgi:hypothetical protein
LYGPDSQRPSQSYLSGGWREIPLPSLLELAARGSKSEAASELEATRGKINGAKCKEGFIAGWR